MKVSLRFAACVLMCVSAGGISSCLPEDDGSEVQAEPPGPPVTGTETLNLFVEVDYHARTKTGSNVQALDLVPYVEEFSSILVGTEDAFQCNQRFARVDGGTQRIVNMAVQQLDSAEVNWTPNTIVTEAKAQYPNTVSNYLAVGLLLGKTKKGRDYDKLPNLHLLAGEHYLLAPTYTYPNVSQAQLDNIVLGLVWTGNTYVFPPDTWGCYFAQGQRHPVGVIFVREIEKMVKEMNTHMVATQCFGSPPLDLRKYVRKYVFHELFHELYLPDYHPQDTFKLYCHDGDTTCKCVMNEETSFVAIYYIGQNRCSDAITVLQNSQQPCIDWSHYIDGCSWVNLVFHNPHED